MVFTSLSFLYLCTSILVLYYFSPIRFRKILLLIASYYFYMNWKPEAGIILFIITVINYFIGIKIYDNKSKYTKKLFLIFGICINIGVLIYFKYVNFIGHLLGLLFERLNIFIDIQYINIIAPIGISYYIFKTLSYIIDIYNDTGKVEKNFIVFALYVSFFPEIMMGPIDRANSLIPQFHKKYTFDYNRICTSSQLILWGLFKKLVIADRIAILVNTIYNNPTKYTGVYLMLATYGFIYQLYNDFSGYTDIARGVAKMFGFDLVKNFNRPFQSETVSEFWRRWHISLSSWFNDYVFSPISFHLRYCGKYTVIFATIVTFTLTGLWHGAKLTFVILGLLHGMAISFEILTKKTRKKIAKKIPTMLYKHLNIILTFNFVVFTMIFFRSNTFSDAIYIVRNLFNFSYIEFKNLGIDIFDSYVLLISAFTLFLKGYLEKKYGDILSYINTKSIFVRWSIYYYLLFSIIILGVYEVEEKAQFIYFQF